MVYAPNVKLSQSHEGNQLQGRDLRDGQSTEFTGQNRLRATTTFLSQRSFVIFLNYGIIAHGHTVGDELTVIVWPCRGTFTPGGAFYEV